jgi:hypothetical protein
MFGALAPPVWAYPVQKKEFYRSEKIFLGFPGEFNDHSMEVAEMEQKITVKFCKKNFCSMTVKQKISFFQNL